MKTYSDLQAIDSDLDFVLHLQPLSRCQVSVHLGDRVWQWSALEQKVAVAHTWPLMQPFDLQVTLVTGEVKLQSFVVDGIELLPRFDYLANYGDRPTSWLSNPGCWCLSIDRPFYHWLHDATKQGWLIK